VRRGRVNPSSPGAHAFTIPPSPHPLHFLPSSSTYTTPTLPYNLPDAFMTDLAAVLPGFPTHKYVRLLPSLEKNQITTADLLTLDCVEIAKRAQLPLLDLKRLSSAILDALQGSLGVTGLPNGASGTSVSRKSGNEILNSWNSISTLDNELDRALGGGIPVGYITEVTGERLVNFIPSTRRS
jgi:hypothetical protein